MTITYYVARWTPTVLAGALFGWRGAVWGFISTLCADALRGRT